VHFETSTATTERFEELWSSPRSLLDLGLREVEDRTLEELDLVRESLHCAVEAARTGDSSIADRVVAFGRDAERRYEQGHAELMELIARQTPVASDLRLAIALLHVNDRIARMSSQCANITTLTAAVEDHQQLSGDQVDCLCAMGRLAEEQVAEARRVFAERDVDALAEIRAHDLDINEANRRCFTMAAHAHCDEGGREAALFVAMMARAIERVGDNAVDIARQVAFVVTGRLHSVSAPFDGKAQPATTDPLERSS
jgi:phosphate transport system protein